MMRKCVLSIDDIDIEDIMKDRYTVIEYDKDDFDKVVDAFVKSFMSNDWFWDNFWNSLDDAVRDVFGDRLDSKE